MKKYIIILLILASLSLSQTWRGGNRADYTANDICADAYMLHRPGTIFPDKSIADCCADTVFAYGRVCTLIVDGDTLILPVVGSVDTLYFGSDTIYSFDTVLVIGSGLRFTTHKIWSCDSVVLAVFSDSIVIDSLFDTTDIILTNIDSSICVFCDSITIVNWFTVETTGDTTQYDVWQFAMGTRRDSCGIIDLRGLNLGYAIYDGDLIIQNFEEIHNHYNEDCGFWYFDSVNSDYMYIACEETLKISYPESKIWIRNCVCDVTDTVYGNLLDIVFVADTSGSMSNKLAGVIASIDTFAADIHAIDSTARFSWVNYCDNISYPMGTELYDFATFSSMLYVPGDMGGWEFHSLTLQEVLRTMNWRRGAQPIIIMISDENEDGVRRSGVSVPGTRADFDFLSDKFLRYGARLFSIMGSEMPWRYPIHWEYFDSISTLTGGEYYECPVDVPFVFDTIFDSIATILTGYINDTTYTTVGCWQQKDSLIIPPCSVLVYCADGTDTTVIYFGSEPQKLPNCASVTDPCDTLCFYFPQGWSVPTLYEYGGWVRDYDTVVCLSTCELDTLDMSGWAYAGWTNADGFRLFSVDTSETLTIFVRDTIIFVASTDLLFEAPRIMFGGAVEIQDNRLMFFDGTQTDTTLLYQVGDTFYIATSDSMIYVKIGNESVIIRDWAMYFSSSYVDSFGTAFGHNCNVLSDYSAIAGGRSNTINIDAGYSIVSGGRSNTINAGGVYSGIVSGYDNITDGSLSFIGGGFMNSISSSNYSSILGGQDNVVGESYSSISGGQDNVVGGGYSSILGGQDNVVGGGYSSILGGRHNSIAAGNLYSMVFGNDVDINQNFRVQFFDADSSGHFVVNYADDSVATAGLTVRGGIDTDSLKIGTGAEWLKHIQFVGDTLRITIGTETKDFLAVE